MVIMKKSFLNAKFHLQNCLFVIFKVYLIKKTMSSFKSTIEESVKV